MLIVSVFTVVYLIYIARKTAHQKLDVYDFVMLSSLGVIPFLFAVFPGVAAFAAEVTGVVYPFVALFGLLFIFIFVFVHRLTEKVHSLEQDNRMLVQEISLLRQALEQPRGAKSDSD